MQKDGEIIKQLEHCVKRTHSAINLFKLAKAFNRFIEYVDFNQFDSEIKSFVSTYSQREQTLYTKCIARPYKVNFWVFLLYKF